MAGRGWAHLVRGKDMGGEGGRKELGFSRKAGGGGDASQSRGWRGAQMGDQEYKKLD